MVLGSGLEVRREGGAVALGHRLDEGRDGVGLDHRDGEADVTAVRAARVAGHLGAVAVDHALEERIDLGS
jgi:hypothetical protein